jgi:hypothetical protein
MRRKRIVTIYIMSPCDDLYCVPMWWFILSPCDDLYCVLMWWFILYPHVMIYIVSPCDDLYCICMWLFILCLHVIIYIACMWLFIMFAYHYVHLISMWLFILCLYVIIYTLSRSESSVSHNSVAKDLSLLGYDAVSLDGCFCTFGKILLPSSSEPSSPLHDCSLTYRGTSHKFWKFSNWVVGATNLAWWLPVY